MFHFLWIVLLSNFQGENPSWRESILERIHHGASSSGENPPWRESTMERIHPGESNSGENPPWESTLERAILEKIRPDRPSVGRLCPLTRRCPTSCHTFSNFFLNFFNVFFKQMFGFVHFDRGKCYVESFAKTKWNRQGVFYVCWFWLRYARLSLFQ